MQEEDEGKRRDLNRVGEVKLGMASTAKGLLIWAAAYVALVVLSDIFDEKSTPLSTLWQFLRINSWSPTEGFVIAPSGCLGYRLVLIVVADQSKFPNYYRLNLCSSEGLQQPTIKLFSAGCIWCCCF